MELIVLLNYINKYYYRYCKYYICLKLKRANKLNLGLVQSHEYYMV